MITSLHSAENANWVHSYPAVLVLNIKQGINNNKEFYNYIFRQNQIKEPLAVPYKQGMHKYRGEIRLSSPDGYVEQAWRPEDFL